MMEAELPEEAPLPGPLQLQLQTGEFGLLRRIRVFESDFVQVSRRGEVLDVHNRMRVVTVGVARTSPGIPVPNVLLLARPCAPPPAAGVELTRLLPLRWVQVSVQDALREQLRLRFANGRSFYLQLCPCPGTPGLFDRWACLVRVLRPPGEAPPPAPGEALRPVGGVAPEEAPGGSAEAEGSRAGAPEPPPRPSSLPQPVDGGGSLPPPDPPRSPPSRAEAPPPMPRGLSPPACRKACRLRELPAAQRKPSYGRRPSRIVALVKSLSGATLVPGSGKR